MQFALQPIHRYLEKRLEQIDPQRFCTTVDDSRVVPMMVDNSKVVPMTPDESRVTPLMEQMEKKLGSRLYQEHGTLLAVPPALEEHVPSNTNYITLQDLKNVGVVSTR